MKMKRRALSMLLALAVVVTFMPMMTVTVSAASKSKVYTVTKEKNTEGDTVKYTYNKKGLVTKSVAKWTSKDSNSDTVNTVTTTYKYNKKNRVSKKVVKDVTKETYYNTDNTTGKITTPQGTVTTTDTYTTKYTYNKKGLAKKSVTTKETTMSGSYTSTDKNRAFSAEYVMNNGQLIADWDWVEDEATHKYNKVYKYWTGAVNDAVSDSTRTVTYVSTGKGQYKEIIENTDTNANYSVDYANYVVSPGTDGHRVLSSYTKKEYDFADSVKTTTTYKYDKKKRVKSAVSTEVTTGNSVDYADIGSVRREVKYADGSSYVSTDSSPVTRKETVTKKITEKYSYDKKGHAKKLITTDNGISNRTVVETVGLENYEAIESDGSKYTIATTGADCESITTTVTAGGTRTVTTDIKPYVVVVDGIAGPPREAKVETKTSTVRYNEEALVEKETTTFKYDKNGNLKSAKSSSDGKYFTEVQNDFGESIYEFVNAENIDPEDNPYQNPEVLKVVVNKVTKESVSKANTVKKGSKRLKSVIAVGTSKYDRGTPSVAGYLSGKVTYTLKAKKLSKKLAKNAELQQWILQNGALNGVVGL